ncbi:hypothetical protein GCM10010347_52750 [Streptomyces cirratus]|uniref:Uncharacterized protein n=1 Tax=Streptomyces cirratus TaxID=68187 RepID=A0ABQ3EZ25_9ACTN|nr:hypothetical protein [Streptomyces cirratus]GHB75742.1 hypothetical protein GCM10010347_52750 [Streptomyces cirratus]
MHAESAPTTPYGVQGAVLEGRVVCGACGEPCLYAPAGPGAYLCGSGCQPAVPAAELEQRVGRAVMERLYSPGGLVRMAAAQELLHGLGVELAYPVPVSARHAVHQWSHDFDRDTRRSTVSDALLAVVVGPAPQGDSGGEVRLFFAWRRPRADPHGPGTI